MPNLHSTAPLLAAAAASQLNYYAPQRTGLPPQGTTRISTPLRDLLTPDKRLREFLASGETNYKWYDGTVVRNRQAHPRYRNTVLLTLFAYGDSGKKRAEEFLASVGNYAGNGWIRTKSLGSTTWTLFLWANVDLLPRSWWCAACEDQDVEMKSIDYVVLARPLKAKRNRRPKRADYGFLIHCCGQLHGTDLLFLTCHPCPGPDTLLDAPYLEDLGELVPIAS